MPLDFEKSIYSDNKKNTDNDISNFNFSVFNRHGVLSPGYFCYYAFLLSCVFELLYLLSFFVFGYNLLALSFNLILFSYFLYLLYNLTYKRLTDIEGHNNFNKFLPILFMIPIICLYPMVTHGNITKNLVDEKGSYKLYGENNNFFLIYGHIKFPMFATNIIFLLFIGVLLCKLYIYAHNNLAEDLGFNLLPFLVVWFTCFSANIRKFITFSKSQKEEKTVLQEQTNSEAEKNEQIKKESVESINKTLQSATFKYLQNASEDKIAEYNRQATIYKAFGRAITEAGAELEKINGNGIAMLYRRASYLKYTQLETLNAVIYIILAKLDILKDENNIVRIDPENEDENELNIALNTFHLVFDFIDDSVWEQMYNNQLSEQNSEDRPLTNQMTKEWFDKYEICQKFRDIIIRATGITVLVKRDN